MKRVILLMALMFLRMAGLAFVSSCGRLQVLAFRAVAEHSDVVKMSAQFQDFIPAFNPRDSMKVKIANPNSSTLICSLFFLENLKKFDGTRLKAANTNHRI